MTRTVGQSETASNEDYKTVLSYYQQQMATDIQVYCGKRVRLRIPILPFSVLERLLSRATEIFSSEPPLLTISSPIIIIGDLRGSLCDFLRLITEKGMPPCSRYLFLGNFTGQGDFSLEVATLIFIMKVLWPSDVFVLRGAFEFREVCTNGKLPAEIQKAYRNDLLFHSFLRLFASLPYSAVLDTESLCCSGGIGPGISDLSVLMEFKKPSPSFASANMSDLMLSDPTDALPMFLPNTRGLGGLFGLQSAMTFLKKVKLSRIIRGRQRMRDGFEWSLEGHVLTVFSASEITAEGSFASCWCIVDQPQTDFRFETRPALVHLKRNEVGMISSESETCVMLGEANAVLGSGFARVARNLTGTLRPAPVADKKISKLNMTMPKGRRLSTGCAGKPMAVCSRMVLEIPVGPEIQNVDLGTGL
jgi:hypothetical protein